MVPNVSVNRKFQVSICATSLSFMGMSLSYNALWYAAPNEMALGVWQ
jgi:hypothetical protein